MSVERTFHCDGPDCERHVRTPREEPPVFVVVREFEVEPLHFCGWDCVLRYAANRGPEEVVPA